MSELKDEEFAYGVSIEGQELAPNSIRKGDEAVAFEILADTVIPNLRKKSHGRRLLLWKINSKFVKYI